MPSSLVPIAQVPGVLREIGITPGRKYRIEDFRSLLTRAKADSLKVQGYVLRMDMDGYVEIVHFSQADDFQGAMHGAWRMMKQAVKGPRGDRRMLTAPGFDGAKDPGGPPVQAGTIAPTRKRTPQQRLDSLMQRWVDDCLRTGTVPGLDDPMISVILDSAFASGKTGITAENVRTVARFFLEDAERKKAEANRKLIVTPPHGS